MNKLYIVGCGIKFLSHMTLEVQTIIKQSDCVVYLVNDPAMKRWIEENSINPRSLDSIYFASSVRNKVYDAICQEVISITTHYECTCFVMYGHPFFLSNSSQQLIRDIEEKLLNIYVEILPGISSLDSLFCDLRIDPGSGGIQAYEATEFIQKDYKINSNGHFFLWQIGVAGITNIIDNYNEFVENKERKNTLVLIQNKLSNYYMKTHRIILYVASLYPSIPFERIDITLEQLDSVYIPRLSTAYIPPIK